MTLLTGDELDDALAGLEGWTHDPEARAIRRRFLFPDFARAFAFMSGVALEAEKADHHPDWSNSWNKVDVALSTHDAGGVTQKDLDLARRMDRLAAGLLE
jgi:4a-hydroxytetrahydrobiopterin dehydratase